MRADAWTLPFAAVLAACSDVASPERDSAGPSVAAVDVTAVEAWPGDTVRVAVVASDESGVVGVRVIAQATYEPERWVCEQRPGSANTWTCLIVVRAQASYPAAWRLTAIEAVDAAGNITVAPQAAALTILAPLIARIEIAAVDVITLDEGDSAALSVDGYDARGVATRALPAEWTSAHADLARVNAAGRVHAVMPGGTWIRAQHQSGLADSVFVWVQPSAATPSSYRITLVFAHDVPARMRAELQRAADRWARVIRRELPEAALNYPEGSACPTTPGEPLYPAMTGSERGTRIYVGMSGRFRETHYVVEALGGPCVQRPLPFPTTVLGQITLNRLVDFDTVKATRIEFLAAHEMGHVLGLVGVVQGTQPEWLDRVNHRITGVMTREGYRREFGEHVDFVSYQSGSHWPWPDLMGSGYDNTYVTVGMLMDFGYPAAWYGADQV